MRVPRLSALVLALLVVPLSAHPQAARAQGVEDGPYVVLEDMPFGITLNGGNAPSAAYRITDAQGQVLAAGVVPGGGTMDVGDISLSSSDQLPLQVTVAGEESTFHPTLIPGWFSLLPPLIAIALALIFREVITALFAGVWLGALMVAGWNPLTATWRVIDYFAVPAVSNMDDGHTQILVFSLLLGGMVGIIARNGGTLGIVEAVAPFARSSRRGKIATWAAGLFIFFDDYANTLIVGNTMRPITDRLKISREKLAYIVDSTAAPVAALVPISTWVGYEISLIADGLRIAGEQNPASAEVLAGLNPFSIFVQTIPYLFYPLLALAFVFLTSFLDRDLGAMAVAEKRAATGGGLYRPGAQLATDTSSHLMDPKEGADHKWWNAAIPVLTVIVVVLVGLYTTGRAATGPGASLMNIFGAASSFDTLLWGSLAGCLAGIILSVGQRILTVQESIDAWLGGMKAMMIAMIILTLAWSLGKVTEEVGTAQFLSQVLSDRVALHLIPVIVFATSAAMAFATGTSWGVMAIMVPLVIPLTAALGGAEVLPGAESWHVLLGSISSVLAGAIFGDHCSPISDTTVLSSTASACDHVDHVRTQLPYALLVAVVGMALGDIGTAYGLPVWVALLLGVVVLFLVLRFKGTKVVAQEGTAAEG